MDGWVEQRFGVHVRGDAAHLVELALRRNPKRAHLLVSTVLGKHLPADPRVVHEHGLRLGREVGALLGVAPGLVLGYAETATGLGHCVAEALGAPYLHSTRREVATVPAAGRFEEVHSHATGHLLLPEDPRLLDTDATVVLVDDELSTGRTAVATIQLLQQARARGRYVIAALVDARSSADHAATEQAAHELGTRIDVVALGAGEVHMPADFAVAAADVVRALQPSAAQDDREHAELVSVPGAWHARDGGRHGFDAADVAAARSAARAQTAHIAPAGRDVLVLGTEELMYAPLLIALELSDRPALRVRFSSTTRSPVLVVDEPGYPIRTRLRYDTADGERYAYNVSRGFDDVVLVTDEPAVGLVSALRAVCARVHIVHVPSYRPALPEPLCGPAFGSYAADEVSWLLTDLSAVELEAPTEEREEAVQSGGAHYAESLPIEYQPSVEYQQLFAAALHESAARLAHAVGVVTELVLAERGTEAVLVSLARAGTPVGILLRRWASWAHGIELAHHAVSIVRGRGIDEVALRWLAVHHDPARVVFVDGWTGKGAIARELDAALAGSAFSAELTVLADTGSCVRTFGTRADYLIPSACLNSTVSGLVSRTVLNDTVLRPGQFHGAKFYKDLAHADVSATFLDAVGARFPDVAESVASDWPVVRSGDRTPTWAGWRAVEAIAERYGVGSVNLVKPGVGETTRVLLRRVPWRVLVRPDAVGELRHVLMLAEQRGVPVEWVDDLDYSCVGIIHPQFTRGATGADGTRTVAR